MKYFYLIIVLVLQFLSVKIFKLLDNFGLLVFGFAITLLIGILISVFAKKDNKQLRDVGWGLLYSSFITIGLIFVFMIYLTFNWPK
jgi:ABC-type Mn2+/Zn2+ transport system permease subunit